LIGTDRHVSRAIAKIVAAILVLASAGCASNNLAPGEDLQTCEDVVSSIDSETGTPGNASSAQRALGAVIVFLAVTIVTRTTYDLFDAVADSERAPRWASRPLLNQKRSLLRACVDVKTTARNFGSDSREMIRSLLSFAHAYRDAGAFKQAIVVEKRAAELGAQYNIAVLTPDDWLPCMVRGERKWALRRECDE
jgi:hypothetical protein